MNPYTDNFADEQVIPDLQDWYDSLDAVIHNEGVERAGALLKELRNYLRRSATPITVGSDGLVTDYINTIRPESQPAYPGDYKLERRIKSLIRWNAMAMVVRANRESDGIGGHISTYASCATLYEVAFNHFFRGREHASGGDHIFFQGHAAPGFYARSFLEGRFTQEQLKNFRRELHPKGGLSSYPHPWLMPKYWEFPTVSMGLGAMMAIYRARFMRYLENRGLKENKGEKVWAFLGDGECDEPETLGALTVASREGLNNLIFVVNCNLQRLDGPVRGNFKIIQELEGVFRGAGWNVIKVITGTEWDSLFERDTSGALIRRFNQALDGDFQKYLVEGGAYTREHFFGKEPGLAQLVEDLSDNEIWKLRHGGHDSRKIYAAYQAAMEHTHGPTVILAKTIKGYGLGEAGEGRNMTHQQKKLNDKELLEFRDRFEIPISDQDVKELPFYRPPADSPEMQYLLEKRKTLGGFVPQRKIVSANLPRPGEDIFKEFFQGSDTEVSTTMAMVRILTKLLRDKQLGKSIVPIVPDEARTFGMDALFRQVGIYSPVGQRYEPVDKANLMYYKESKDGQLMEEGITEAGSICSFIAAGTSHTFHGVATIPFYFYYSMFGLQRVGDFVWAAADQRTRGFLIGGTAGRTTLAGEGLQHQDGHSHVLALPVPNLKAYDPAFAFEIAVIVREGIRRMYENDEDIFYYLTVGNENYKQLAMPQGVEENILRGMYCFRKSQLTKAKLKVQLFGSGAIMNCVLEAQKILEEQYQIAADVWSITSYKELQRDALACERWNLLNPEKQPRRAYISQCLRDITGPYIAAADYMKVLTNSLAKWFPGRLVALGTDGFGRSESRERLRDFFEVDARWIALNALSALSQEGKLQKQEVEKARNQWNISADKEDPFTL